MVSIWWVVWALLVGGLAGFLGFSLIAMARSEGNRAEKAKQTVELDGLGALKLHKNWTGKHNWSANFE